nr:DUF6193 family natural product biosynthesis protein [Streptomyces sp. RPT161]
MARGGPRAGGGYWVAGPLRTASVGPTATAEAAVAMVIRRLPPDADSPSCVSRINSRPAHEAKFKDRHRLESAESSSEHKRTS